MGEGRSPSGLPGLRAAWAEVDLGAVVHNVEVLRRRVDPARLCAVVKAGGYGHGAVEVARAALAGGADWLAVALVEEGMQLREAGIGARILLLSEPRGRALAVAVATGLTPTLYSLEAVEELQGLVSEAGPLPVHLKVDTGMHRVGAELSRAAEVAKAIDASPGLHLEGLWSHFAVADEPARDFTSIQHDRFQGVVAELARSGIVPEVLHLCNSAGALAHRACHLDLVRCGIALYGLAPSHSLAHSGDLRPAMALKARVSSVRRVPAGDGVSYGLNYRLDQATTVATVPLGYADGVAWQLAHRGGEVLVRGRRRPIAGNVTMDQLMVDCGSEEVEPGEEAVIFGRQGGEEISAWEVAARTDTIAYEVVCRVGPRVPRVYLSASADAPADEGAR